MTRNTPVFAIMIAVTTLTVFSGVLGARFVMWDDDISIYNNPNLGGISIARLQWVFTDFDTMMRYNPLTLLAWVLTYQFFGLDPLWYHLGNWLLHAASAVLLFLAIREILLRVQAGTSSANNGWQTDAAAALAAFCWALHPLRVEPVAWATDRTYCQATAFLLLSVLLYLIAHRPAPATGRINRWLLAAALASYTVSLFSHAIGISFVAVFLILDIFVLGRAGGRAGWRSRSAHNTLLEKAVFAVPALAIAGITVAVRVASAGVWKPPVPLEDFGLLPRLMQALYVAARYAYRPFWPAGLAPVYTTLVSFDPLAPTFVFSAVGVTAAITIAIVLRRRVAAVPALAAAYLALLLPVMGFLEHPHYACDRYSLLPALPLSLAAALALMQIRSRRVFVIAIGALTVIVSLLGWLSSRQVRVWHDSETLFRHTIQTLDNDSYSQDIHWRLGKYLVQQRRYGEAIDEFERTLRINPNHMIAQRYLTDLELSRGNYQRAADHLRALMAIDPGNQLLRQKLEALLQYLRTAPPGVPRNTTGNQ